METVQVDGKVKKLGMKDIQREGFEYELTCSFNIDREKHLAISSKDRTGLFIDRDPFVIGEETGRELMEWNQSWEQPLTNYQKCLMALMGAKTLDELKAAYEDSGKYTLTKEEKDHLVEVKDDQKKELSKPKPTND